MASGNKALFLDRDGTINVDRDYLYKIEEFELVPGIIELVKAAMLKSYLVIVATNQSGIARGMYKVEDMHRLHEYMKEEFAKRGAKIDDIFFAPSLEGEDRKPAPGMFKKAAAKYGIDMPASVSVGDKERDVAAAIAAGVGTNLLLSSKVAPTRATAVIRSLLEAREYLK
jgi:D,D-heptose 1,7-bisphosphate phosphatase